jgi:hypothetical protein
VRYSFVKERARDLREFGRFEAKSAKVSRVLLPCQCKKLLRLGGLFPGCCGLALRGRQSY